MAHKLHTLLQDLIDDIKLEDTKVYLELITKINKDKLENSQIEHLLKDKDNYKKLTDNQIELLKTIRFKGGYRLRFFKPYNNLTSPFITRWNSIGATRVYSYQMDLQVKQDDLKYMSTYYISKWKQEHPTSNKKRTKGLQFTFAMNEFSLNIFKNSIKKGFLRTEAKNFILKVNEAYNNSNHSLADKSIRNRFYAVILDNTEVHTKAMLNELQGTDFEKYIPHKDEALVIRLGYSNRGLRGISTPESQDEYPTDLGLCTHMKLHAPTYRALNRYFSAASVMSTLALRTSNNTYKALATRMINNLTQKQLKSFNELTKSVGMLNTMIETNINNKEIQ